MAQVFVVIFGVVSIITVPYGIGKHSWAVEPTNVWKIMRVRGAQICIHF